MRFTIQTAQRRTDLRQAPRNHRKRRRRAVIIPVRAGILLQGDSNVEASDDQPLPFCCDLERAPRQVGASRAHGAPRVHARREDAAAARWRPAPRLLPRPALAGGRGPPFRAVNISRWHQADDHDGTRVHDCISFISRARARGVPAERPMDDKKRALVSRLMQRAECARVAGVPHADVLTPPPNAKRLLRLDGDGGIRRRARGFAPRPTSTSTSRTRATSWSWPRSPSPCAAWTSPRRGSSGDRNDGRAATDRRRGNRAPSGPSAAETTADFARTTAAATTRRRGGLPADTGAARRR